MESIPRFAYLILIAGTALWFLPFPLMGWSRKSPQKRDPRARWGILLEVAGYTAIWQGQFWTITLPVWRLTLAVVFLVLACLLSWTSTHALGRHLRFEAALDADHQLVRGGPYRIVRHPIYASMLCLLLGTALMVATPLLTTIGLVLFVVGTEVRVRVEDSLLSERFGDEFEKYRRSTSAYIPMMR